MAFSNAAPLFSRLSPRDAMRESVVCAGIAPRSAGPNRTMLPSATLMSGVSNRSRLLRANDVRSTKRSAVPPRSPLRLRRPSRSPRFVIGTRRSGVLLRSYPSSTIAWRVA